VAESGHATTEGGIVGAAAAQVVKHGHQTGGLFRRVVVQPFAEQSGYLVARTRLQPLPPPASGRAFGRSDVFVLEADYYYM
jgi:hypothetical protein